MKLSTLLSDEVRSTFVPLSKDAEGLLQGGFGSLTISAELTETVSNNCLCGTSDNCSCPSYQQTKPRNNCSCPSDESAFAPATNGNNCTCAHGNLINNCSCKTSTTAKSNGLISVMF